MDNRIVIDIELNDGTIVKGIAKAEKTSANSAKRIGNNLEKNVNNGIVQGFKNLDKIVQRAAAAVAGIFIAKKIISGFRAVTKEAADFDFVS